MTATDTPGPGAPGLHEREAPAVPTQEGPLGIRFDYNDGGRVFLPKADHDWFVRLTDVATSNVLYESTMATGLVRSQGRVPGRGVGGGHRGEPG